MLNKKGFALETENGCMCEPYLSLTLSSTPCLQCTSNSERKSLFLAALKDSFEFFLSKYN